MFIEQTLGSLFSLLTTRGTHKMRGRGHVREVVLFCFFSFSRTGAFYRRPGFRCHCDKRQQEGERSGRQLDNG